MTPASIVLVAGFWLGAWAWDDVAPALRAEGHRVTAITLPGLESPGTDRSSIRMADHVEAICDVVRAEGAPVVLVVHSGAGLPGYGASDRVYRELAAMVYVDCIPRKLAFDPDLAGVEVPLPTWDELEADDCSLAELSAEQLDVFRRRAVPEPGAAYREAPVLTDERRLDVPSIVLCTALSSEEVKDFIWQGGAGAAGLAELRDVTYVDLPTSHWPMWSRPADLARIISGIAKARGSEGEAQQRAANA